MRIWPFSHCLISLNLCTYLQVLCWCQPWVQRHVLLWFLKSNFHMQKHFNKAIDLPCKEGDPLFWNIARRWERKQMMCLPSLCDKMDRMTLYAFCISKFNYADINCPPRVDDCLPIAILYFPNTFSDTPWTVLKASEVKTSGLQIQQTFAFWAAARFDSW